MLRTTLALALGFAALALGLAAVAADAQPVPYVYQLQARANFAGAFNLPDSAFFTNATPRMNDAGQVAFDLEVLPGAGQGVWFGTHGAGEVVYSSAVDTFVFDVGMNGSGVVVFDLSQSPQDGVYRFDPGTGLTTFATNQPLGASGWGSPQINDAGEIAFRASFPGGQAFVRVAAGSGTTVYVAEAGIDIASPYSFLFTPSFNGSGHIAAKVRRGAAGQFADSQPDEIRIFHADGSSLVVATDHDGDPNSPYQSFDNAVSLNDDDQVAFLATRVGGVREVVLYDGTGLVSLALASQVGSLEFFAPACGPDGSVAFRGIDLAGLRTIWLARPSGELVPVIREHDVIPTDLGLARIDQHDASPVFGGGPTINRQREVVFNAALTPAGNDQIEWGSGIFVARRNEAIFADGFDTGNFAAWSASLP